MKDTLESFQKQVAKVQTTEERNTKHIDNIKSTYSYLYRENSQLRKQVEISSQRIEDLQTKENAMGQKFENVSRPLFFFS